MDTRTVGILGGGQLGRMLVEAASNRNIPTAILDKNNSPAKQINANTLGVDGSFTDPKAIRRLARKCDILTVEIEHVDTHVLEEIEKESQAEGKNIEVQPSWETVRIIQDKYLQKERLIENKVDIAESIPIATASEDALAQAAGKLGLPFMLKARTGAYDGRGNYVVKTAGDYKAALKALEGRPLYAERWANFAKELAVMVVKTDNEADAGSWETLTLSYPTVETVHEDSICKLVYAPARGISDEVNLEAQKLARRAIASFKGKGIFGVEMFVLSDNTILVNEIAPRPHNSGHYTIEACRLSQYDLHLLAILDRPISSKAVKLLNPAIMLNILGGVDPKSFLELADTADAIGAKVHLYGKGSATRGRKMGHLTVLGDSMEEAEKDIGPLITIADKIRAQTTSAANTGSAPSSKSREPQVSIVTGSISDQPHLEACYKILKDFDIPFEKGIKSAHRTPRAMADFAEDAAERGVKVIIAAAGGAAHLPGMVSAFSKVVPVIGLPIKPTIGDGTDSLLSMTNMPRGCPVLTVGVNNSVNAALGAARILAMWDDKVKAKVAGYVQNASDESLGNDEKLQAENPC
ncbi:phosphoribosylaminoimidazole carboxylase ade2 [Arachnomyces sp. PD_36]|nr:phosphoribosylaminoimidazole carboxylase ade2 [Arachnomyces sp. PD_36]